MTAHVAAKKSSARGKSLEETFAAICEAQPSALLTRYEDAKLVRSWQIGRKKVFGFWYRKAGEGAAQLGPHVRSNDVVIRSDARVKPTTIVTRMIEKTNNFIWLDPSANWSTEELEKLIAASHHLSLRKDAGIKRGGEFADLFIALRKALVMAPAEMRPAPPYHAGGPAAKILGNEGPSSQALAVWAAKQLAPFVPAEEKKKFDRSIALAENPKARYEDLLRNYYDKGGSRALRGARAAQLARASSDTSASSYAAETVCLLLEQFLEEKKTADTVRSFLEEVDDRILNSEFAAVAYTKLERDDVTCERVLWRSTDATGNANRWLARIAPRQYALIAKIGPRWEMQIADSRDDVLATVPDNELEAATNIVFKRDQPGAFGVGAIVKGPRWAKAAKKKDKKDKKKT